MKRIEIHFWGFHLSAELDLWFDRDRFFCNWCDEAFSSKKKLARHITFECGFVGEPWT